ncbi:hypothetical protein WYI_22960 [Ochrobactrum sp. CDB2]|nr:hypothetical protein WYI_22960 [Ochrobactrum sp. CDB2]
MMASIDGRVDVWQRRCRWVLSAFYGLAGILHIVLPKPFLVITPAWVPEPETVIFLTGLCEIAGAAGLLVPRLRKAAAIGLALYAVCVFPANIKHAIDGLGDATASLCNASIIWSVCLCNLLWYGWRCLLETYSSGHSGEPRHSFAIVRRKFANIYCFG